MNCSQVTMFIQNWEKKTGTAKKAVVEVMRYGYDFAVKQVVPFASTAGVNLDVQI